MKDHLYKLFLWLSGSDTDIVEKSPRYEHIKHAMYGALVLVPAMLAFFAMTYAISTIIKISDGALTGGLYWKIALSVLLGLSWSIVVLIFDRFIVSTFRKSKSLFKDTVLSWVFITRIFFAAFVGITVAHPLVLLIFNDSISHQLNITKQNEKDAITKKWENKIGEIDKKVLLANAFMKKLDRHLTNEINGVKSTDSLIGTTTGFRGSNLSADNIMRQIDNNKAELVSLQTNKNNIINACNKEIAAFDSTYSKDYLARTKSLCALEKDPTVKATKEFIIFFFIFVDILPITWKVLTKREDYDEYIETSVFKAKREQETEREKIDQENRTAVKTIKLREIFNRSEFIKKYGTEINDQPENIGFAELDMSSLIKLSTLILEFIVAILALYTASGALKNSNDDAVKISKNTTDISQNAIAISQNATVKSQIQGSMQTVKNYIIYFQ